MTQDIHLAFDHPSARASATAPTAMLDRISLRDHVVEVDIGAFQAERGTTQRVQFNVVVEVTPRDDPGLDDVDRILSYDRVTEAIAAELAAERLNLLETLAERVAERILAEPQAVRAFVRIEKLDRGPGALGVEIVRTRATQSEVETPAVAPHLVMLDSAQFDARELPAWLDSVERQDAAFVICVGVPDFAAPAVDASPVQRRIDLLALEQNAWRLAARDKRCVVVDTRTELDWAMKNGQISVWAPSKLVLDAVDGPKTADPAALALWLAGELDASAVTFVGALPPAGPERPVRVATGLSDLL